MLSSPIALFLIWLLVAAHIVVVAILIVCSFLAATGWLQNRRFWLWAYLVTLAGTVLSFIIFGSCILTDWERALRAQYFPETAYEGGFVSHYADMLGLGITDVMAFGGFVVAFTYGLGGLVYHKLKGRQ
jgi:hypothetical protein